MLRTTEAIVLRSIKYGDHSRVIKLYTLDFGVQSYLVQGLHKPKSRFSMAHFQPLNVLEIVGYHNPQSESLRRLREVSVLEEIGQAWHMPAGKAGVAMLLAELVFSSAQEEAPNPGLFGLLRDTARFLGTHEGALHLSPHWTIAHMTRYLGFFPLIPSAPQGALLDLVQGAFLPFAECHTAHVPADGSALLLRLFRGARADAMRLPAEAPVRRNLMGYLMQYYQWHVPGFREPRSFHVLAQLSA
jgi:DNA repair protein RecO (recombination protein O)